MDTDDIEFLTFDDVLAVHAEMLNRYGGRDGILDENIVRSAVDMPQMAAFGQEMYPGIEGKAGAYLYHFAAAQGFVDGNKRTGVGACVLFLARNGYMLDCSNDEIYDVTMRVACRLMDAEGVAAWIRTVIQPIPDDHNP